MSKSLITAIALITIAGTAGAFAAPSCNVDKTEWQAEQVLHDKLTALKWTIKKVKIDNGCYEVYGTDDKGQRVEIYFNPKTLEAVPGQQG